MLDLKIDQATFDNLAPDVQKEYTQQDGAYFLEVNGENAMKALTAERKLKAAAEAELETLKQQVEPLGDLEAAAKLVQDEKTGRYKKLANDGKVDDLLKEKETEWKRKFEKQQELFQRQRQDSARKDVRNTITAALTKHGAHPERLDDAIEAVMRDTDFELGEDDKLQIRFKDANGFSQDVEPEAFIGKFKETKGFYFQPSGKTGAGGRNQPGGGSPAGHDNNSGLSARERLKQAHKAKQ